MKKTLIRLGFILILALLGLILYNSANDSKKDTKKDTEIVDAKPIAYEILDDSVQLTKDVDKWMNESMKKEGFYTKKTEKERFVIISGWKKATTGYGISLNEVKQKGNTLHVEYEVIAPSKTDKVEKKETNPHMILRVASKNAEVKGRVSKMNEEKPENNEETSKDKDERQ